MPQQQEPPTRDQLKVIALKQRIGEITSDYEEKIADIRAYVTQMEAQYDQIMRNHESEMEALQAQLRKYQDEPVQEEDSTADAED